MPIEQVEIVIAFQRLPVEQFRSSKNTVVSFVTPPYGERIGDSKGLRGFFVLWERPSHLHAWSLFILNAHPEFETFFGIKSIKTESSITGILSVIFMNTLQAATTYKIDQSRA